MDLRFEVARGDLLVFGEIALNAILFLAIKGRIGEDDTHAITFANVGEIMAEGVVEVDFRDGLHETIKD